MAVTHGILLLVPADALEAKRRSRGKLSQSLAGGLIEDLGRTVDAEVGVLPGEDLEGEVGA
jgi:hypothetical protein